MTKSNDSITLYRALEPMIIETIKKYTKTCMRAKKMTCATAPNVNAGTIGIQEYGDETVHTVPYFGRAGNVEVGNPVWVRWYFDDFSTAEAFDDVTITSGTTLPGNGNERDIFILLGDS